MNLKDKALYHLCKWPVWAVSLLPLRVLYAISDFLYALAYHVARYRVGVVRKNLADSFPEKSKSELRSIERRFYRFFCDYMMETVKMATISKEEMGRRIRFHNMELIDEAVRKGHSIALYIGHYCNWEWITYIANLRPRGTYPGHIYHALESKAIDRLLLDIRSTMGSENIEMGNILRVIALNRSIGKKMVIGFISDQAPFWNNIHHWLTFLNHPDTPVLTGTETIAKKFDFSCVYLAMTRPRRGYYDVEVRMLAEDPRGLPPWHVTDAYFQALEESIRQRPEFWLWTHKRWKRTREEYDKMAQFKRKGRGDR